VLLVNGEVNKRIRSHAKEPPSKLITIAQLLEV
jgi:hypothetical protein